MYEQRNMLRVSNLHFKRRDFITVPSVPSVPTHLII